MSTCCRQARSSADLTLRSGAGSTCRWIARFAALALLVCGSGGPLIAQQEASKAPAAPEFKDLDAFLKSLPATRLPVLDEKMAFSLTAMPLSCLDHPQARPATRGYLWEATYRPVDDFDKTRMFYGCYDWHSAVNSTWALVKALKMFPKTSTGPLIRAKLNKHLAKSNVEGELAYFKDAGQFELPYGYAWTLKLQGELLSWDDPDAAQWAANLAPLARFFSERLIEYFEQLDKPVRTGVHPNSALAMHLLFDYTEVAKDDALKAAVVETARRFYEGDKNCETKSEPGPSDFISPCLAEASIMGRTLEPSAYVKWLDQFLPPLYSADFRPLTQPMDPTLITKPERLAAKSHMIGLAFMRAEQLNRVASALPPSDPRVAAMRRLSAMHGAQGMTAMHVAGYTGTHFLGAFSILYLLSIAAP